MWILTSIESDSEPQKVGIILTEFFHPTFAGRP